MPDPRTAVALRKAARAGNPAAQLEIGRRYYEGRGVRRDYRSAVRCWRLAADQGHAEARYHLAVCHVLGEGVKKSPLGDLLAEARRGPG